MYNYTYDEQKRIIRVKGLHVYSGDRFVLKYSNNQQGNLEQINAPWVGILLQYDNKVNMRRTHPIWQFIDRHFSINNPFKPLAIIHTGCQ